MNFACSRPGREAEKADIRRDGSPIASGSPDASAMAPIADVGRMTAWGQNRTELPLKVDESLLTLGL
jgi:hypothetical protein